MEKFKVVITYFGFSILYLTSYGNGQNICLECEILEKCRVNDTFMFSNKNDFLKIDWKEPGEITDPRIDACLSPGMKIKGKLTDVLCSGSVDRKCHVIRPKYKYADPIKLCAACGYICGCRVNLMDALDVGKRVIVNFVLILSCLLAFFIMAI
ncbi:PREDICTED: uncharacterized protein LOC108615793 [Drosophila arizonae]|uniref:Uncharacterized protein LOC108615793 n=1 Tax=Drosophila arizonae TaxID=7263 RepID=A0ABM1PFR9_DROAR|nr:PREDICTED: uncharacterized protein LOC108615793 [Drosophila arizonae]